MRRRFVEEYAKLVERTEGVVVQLSSLEAWSVLSAVQLASRHPLAQEGPTIAIAKLVALKLQERVAKSGALKVIAERGWDPRYDEVPE